MRHTLLALAIILALGTPAALANTITATVTGMDCAFCAKGLKAELRKDKSVGTVKIDVESGLVVVTSKKDKTVSEDTVRKSVNYMGYKLVKIKNKP